jgi:hypothetical protein
LGFSQISTDQYELNQLEMDLLSLPQALSNQTQNFFPFSNVINFFFDYILLTHFIKNFILQLPHAQIQTQTNLIQNEFNQVIILDKSILFNSELLANLI